MSVDYSAAGDLIYLAGFLVLPTLGAVLFGFGTWRLVRRAKRSGPINPRYDIVLPGSRTVIDGFALAFAFVGLTFFGMGAMQAIGMLAG